MKRKISLLLAALMIASGLAACGGKKEENSTSNNGGTATESTNSDNISGNTSTDSGNKGGEEQADTDPFPGADLGGVTIRVTGLQNPATADEAQQEKWLERQAEVEAKFNIKLKFDATEGIDWNEVPTKIVESFAAGDPIIDFADLSSAYYLPTVVEGGAAVDVSDIVKSYFPEEYYKYGCEVGGKTYGFNPNPITAFCSIVYNRDMIKAAGMDKTPGEMFVEGKWSLTDFYEYCAELKTKLPDGVDVFGMLPVNWLRGASYANNSYIKNPETNAPGYLSDGFIEVMQVFQNMVKDGIATGAVWLEDAQRYTFGSVESKDGANRFLTGQIAMGNGNDWEFKDYAAAIDFGVVPFPWGSKATITNSDYKTLKGYHSYYKDNGVMTLIKGAEKKATPEQMINIVFSYMKEQGETLIANKQRIVNGEEVQKEDFGTPRNFTTDLDIELWDWYIIRAQWEPLDTVTYSSALALAWNKALATGSDIRSGFEAIIGEDTWTMVEGGSLNINDVNADIKAQAEAYAATLEEGE